MSDPGLPVPPPTPDLSLRDAFEHYRRRFARAALDLPDYHPAREEDRREVLQRLRAALGIGEAASASWQPEIKILSSREEVHEGYRVEILQATTWEDCHAPAHLYVPENAEASGSPRPVVLIVCGHAEGGKGAASYRLLARHLARNGCYALICDNIGQGERVPMGHRSVPAIFGAGLTLQGLIVMESMAWLRWIGEQSRFDAARVAVAGNSGGGLLSLLVGALCRDEVAAVASSGYPCTFEFIARKEKVHCHCNLLPGIVGSLEMWQVYGAIAPKPLFLFQGIGDRLFPEDIFLQVAARVAENYREAGAAEAFRFEVFPGAHSWDATRREALARHLCEQLGLEWDASVIIEPGEEDAAPSLSYPQWPEDAATATEVAFRLTGRTHPATALCHVSPPPFRPVGENPALRGNPREIFSQFELYLGRS